MKIITLSTKQVEYIHSNQLELNGGGMEGVLDRNMLESAVGSATAQFDGKLLYETIHMMAAAYMYSLILNHPFNDGNKRTAVMATYTFLFMNGFLLEADEDELMITAIAIAEKKKSRQEIADFLEANSSRYPIKKA